MAIAVLCLTTLAIAQTEQNAPRADVFAGYSWYQPGSSLPLDGKLPSMPKGWGAAFTYYFDQHFGLTLDGGGHYHSVDDIHSITAGPTFMLRGAGMNFFLHGLAGLQNLAPAHGTSNNGFTGKMGGGLDIPLGQRFSLRAIEADYVYAHHNFTGTNGVLFNDPHARINLNGVELRTGLVMNFGAIEKPAALTASCSVQPAEVMVGEPVTATATASNVRKGHTVSYTWASTGGKVTPKDNTATIDTKGMTGGSYTVSARVSDPKSKKTAEATCQSNFTVKEPPKNPPTITCSANPATVQAGTPSTITCDAKSPDNVPVTVSNWTSSAGKITGSGNTATLDTTGAPAGPITVNARATDNRGLTADGNTTVTVEQPPPPPTASKLNSCDFPNKKKPWRVDNTCKAILDDVALRLQNAPDAKLVIVGNQAPNEKRKNLAAERAVDSKAYLSGGEAKQAIDPSRIETRTGSGGTTTADYWLVPAGATFNEPGTTPVDERKVKAIPDHPAHRAPAKKKAAKPATH
ncbi:MAG TPA: hypothetical protein VE994_14250 [Terriglobales bacterium]|nr:hypothetical protein [Terriglobales bacterium]